MDIHNLNNIIVLACPFAIDEFNLTSMYKYAANKLNNTGNGHEPISVLFRIHEPSNVSLT